MEVLPDPRVLRQYAREDDLRAEATARGSTFVQDALCSERYTELPRGRTLLATAYTGVLQDITEELSKKTTGVGGKYRVLLRRVPSEVLTIIGLRVLLNKCTGERPVLIQEVLRDVGRAVEAEAIVAALEKAAPVYLDRTVQYLDDAGTKSAHHRRRTFLAAAEHTIGTWQHWSPMECYGVAKFLVGVVFRTGLFRWASVSGRKGRNLVLAPSDELALHLEDVLLSARPMVRHEPMLSKPDDWTAYGAGGYLTPWMRVRSPMISLHTSDPEIRQWVLDQLPKATVLAHALNKAQSTPYRVNTGALQLLQKALLIEAGALGLPQHGETTRPRFPLPEGWEKDTATPAELEAFSQWKTHTAAWHQADARRTSKKRSIVMAAQQLHKLREEPELYFVTYADYRGRVYFRGTVHPQSHDAIKGCLEFAEPRALGPDGLFWLKAHVAACAGYDKADFPLRVAWTDEHWGRICGWLDDPLGVEPPEADTAFTLYAAATALREALSLPDPSQYLCRIPVTMDATCSGLQHFSAMFRDEVGGQYTNLLDAGGTEKQDIYRAVATRAQASLSFDDLNVQEFWRTREITRSMAKRPVMTYVYGSTLRSTMDYVSIDLAEAGHQPITDEQGNILYGLTKLAVPVAKALRTGVARTVPLAAAGMKYLQTCARLSTGPLKWVSPSGMPVLNWVGKQQCTRIAVRSMGVSAVVMSHDSGEYAPEKAVDVISPNTVHSLDAAHLCMVLAQAPFEVQPIHDSFGCHPCNVAEMQRILRSTFVELYSDDVLAPVEAGVREVLREGAEMPQRPAPGTLNLRDVLGSRFMFC